MPRIYLGIQLARLGYTTIVGHKFSVASMLRQIGRCEDGIFVHKDINSDATKYLALAKSIGMKVGGNDEEFLNISTTNEGKTIGHPSNINLVDFSIASTEISANILKAQGFTPIVLGNLRFALGELVKKKRLSHSISNGANKKKILISSPCGFLFSAYPFFNHYEIRSRLLDFDPVNDFKVLQDHYLHEYDVYLSLMKLVSELQGQYSICVRAHPAENPEGLKLLFSKFDVKPEIDHGIRNFVLASMGSDCLIATDCTTHLEAYASGLKCYNFETGYKHPADYLSNKFFKKISLNEIRRDLDSDSVANFKDDVLDDIIKRTGIVDRWIAFVSANIKPNVDYSKIIAHKFQGMSPATLPDVARRRGAINLEEIKQLLSLIEDDGEKNPIRLHSMSSDCIAITPNFGNLSF